QRLEREITSDGQMMDQAQGQYHIGWTALGKRHPFAIAPADRRAWVRDIDYQRQEVRFTLARAGAIGSFDAAGVAIKSDGGDSLRAGQAAEVARVGSKIPDRLGIDPGEILSD